MLHTIGDFISIWQAEAKNTEKLLQNITDETLYKETVPGLRTLAQLAWHIIATSREMLKRTGLDITGPDDEIPPSTKIEDIIKEHRQVVDSVAHQIQTHWNNKSLHQTDDMYGERWTRSQTLEALLLHLVHHRGQITVFMRILGLKVPGIYGPSKEEWAQYGMEPPKY